MNEDQLKIDLLYNAVYLQIIRYKHFEDKKIQAGFWNRSLDEREILNNYIKEYINCYRIKIPLIRKKIEEEKQYNTTSYFTYDVKYYENQYEKKMKEINEYEKKLGELDYKNILKTDLTKVSEEIDKYGIMPNKPNLFEKI